MKARQFIAANSREALAMVRRELGPDAVILQNRPVPNGVAITAILEVDLTSMDSTGVAHAPVTGAVKSEGASTPMSTVNFERYANERRQRSHSGNRTSQEVGVGADDVRANETPRTEKAVSASAKPPVGQVYRRGRDETAQELVQMAAELRQMRSFISQQFSALSWVDGVRRTPAQARLLRRMLDAGFSSRLARAMIGHLPDSLADAETDADDWLEQGIAGNLATCRWQDGPLEAGGVFALVGPTGVGKTTSVAKIAARHALTHGVDSVGLITADAYRVGAQDQLRRFGSLIGITVHAAHDAQGLSGLLKMLSRKQLVLIDTAGLGQRDPRVPDLLDAVSRGPVQRLLVLSAAAQVEAMQEAVTAYEGAGCAGILLTKTDEACRLGGAIDTIIRARTPLLGIGSGQRVPEDWVEPDAIGLVRQAFTRFTDVGHGLPDIDMTMLMQRAEPSGSAKDRVIKE